MRLLVAIPIVLLFAAPAMASDVPTRKPGLWEIRMSFDNRSIPVQSIKQCVEPGADKLMQMGTPSVAQSSCSRRDVQRSGNTTTIESTCTFAGKTTNARIVISGSLESAYTMTMTSEGDAVPGGRSSMTMAATWLGPCTAGQKPM